MNNSFSDLLPELRPYLPCALVDDEWLERLADRVGHLPAMATARMTALEVRLQDPACAVDCSVAVGPGHPLMPYYVKRGEAATSGSAAARLGRLLTRLAGNESASGSQPDTAIPVDGVLLEYDIVGVPPEADPEPGVFLCFKYEPDQSATLAAGTDALLEAVGWEDRGVRDAAVSGSSMPCREVAESQTSGP